MTDRDVASHDVFAARARAWRTLELFGLCVAYATAFWGRAAQLLPAPLDQWHSLLYRPAGTWWHAHVATNLSYREQALLYQLIEAIVVAVLLPVWILHRQGSTLRDAGVRLPDRNAIRPTLAGIALSTAFGVYLSRTVPDPWGSQLEEALGLLFVLPEHFLIFGVFGALLLPGRRLTGWRQTDRLGRHEGLAIAAMTTIFALVHVGIGHPAVLIASIPLGAINAYVTLRTASIWPAIAAHWIMNVVPMTWDMLKA